MSPLFRHFLFLLLLLGSLPACKNTVQAPTFLTMEHVKFGGLTTAGAIVKADAVFNNPNGVGVDLTKTDLDILVNGKHAAHVDQSYQIKVPAKRDFRVPLEIKLSPSQVMGDGWSFLKGNKIKVRYKGHVTVRALRMDFKVPVDTEQEMDMSMFNQ